MVKGDSCVVSNADRAITDEYALDDCPDKNGSQVALAIYTVYTVFLNIVLVNLLIAIFRYFYSPRIKQEIELYLKLFV